MPLVAPPWSCKCCPAFGAGTEVHLSPSCTHSQIEFSMGPVTAHKCWKNSTLATTLALKTRHTASFLCRTQAPAAGKTELGLRGSISPSNPRQAPVLVGWLGPVGKHSGLAKDIRD